MTLVAGGMLIAVALTLIATWTARSVRPGSVKRFVFVLPEDQLFTRTGQRNLAISPDGERFVYAANGGLFLRSMGETDARLIAGTNVGPTLPVFSPDGQWIAFNSLRTLKKIAVSGGTAVTVCNWENIPTGLTWNGDYLVFGDNLKGILRVSANGGQPDVIAAAKSSEVMDSPQIINEGRDLLFTLSTEPGPDRWDKAQIVVQSLESGKRKVLWSGGNAGTATPSGHLVFAVGATLMAISFDPKKLEVRGGPIPILDGVGRSAQSAEVQYSVSEDGSLVYEPSAGDLTGVGRREIALVDRSGKVQSLGLPPRPYYHPRISPDGKRLVVGTDDGAEALIWVLDDLKGRSPLRRLTFGGRNGYPIWSRDSHYITFASDREGDRGLFRQPVEGGTAELLVKMQAADLRPESWHRDGKILSFMQSPGGGGGSIWTLPIEGDRKPQLLVQDLKENAQRPNVRYSTFSRDGRWLAYASGQAGVGRGFQIFVQPFPPTGAQYQITTEGGTNPVWSPDGKQLFYNTVSGADQTTAPGKLVVVEIRTQPGFSFGKPVPLPVTGAILGGTGTNYDITPDGKQFVVVQSPTSVTPDAARRPTVNVVLNWFTELQQRVPVK